MNHPISYNYIQFAISDYRVSSSYLYIMKHSTTWAIIYNTNHSISGVCKFYGSKYYEFKSEVEVDCIINKIKISMDEISNRDLYLDEFHKIHSMLDEKPNKLLDVGIHYHSSNYDSLGIDMIRTSEDSYNKPLMINKYKRRCIIENILFSLTSDERQWARHILKYFKDNYGD